MFAKKQSCTLGLPIVLIANSHWTYNNILLYFVTISIEFMNSWNESAVCSWNLFVLSSTYEVNYYLPLQTTTSCIQHPTHLWTDTRLYSPKGKAARQIYSHIRMYGGGFSMLLQNFHDLVFRHTRQCNLLTKAANFCTNIFALVGCKAI